MREFTVSFGPATLRANILFSVENRWLLVASALTASPFCNDSICVEPVGALHFSPNEFSGFEEAKVGSQPSPLSGIPEVYAPDSFFS